MKAPVCYHRSRGTLPQKGYGLKTDFLSDSGMGGAEPRGMETHGKKVLSMKTDCWSIQGIARYPFDLFTVTGLSVCAFWERPSRIDNTNMQPAESLSKKDTLTGRL
jgi:hypothetical protein